MLYDCTLMEKKKKSALNFGVDGLQVQGIGSCRLVCKEVLELRIIETIRNLTSGDLGIPLVVIQLEVSGLKKKRSCIS